MINYTYKFRLYPTKNQEIKLISHFGCCRFVYNYFLEQRKNAYLSNIKNPNYYEQAADLTKLKKINKWMYHTSSQSLQFTLKCLDTAYHKFYKRICKLPKFHNKKGKQSFTIHQQFKIKENKLCFTKFKEGILINLHRRIEGNMRHFTISRNKSGQYHVLITVERDINTLPILNKEVGLDLGISNLITCSDGKIYKNIRSFKKLEKKLYILNKKYNRSKKGGNNREKIRQKIAKLYLKITNIRNDYLHKLTHKIINENQIIYLEKLSIVNMSSNRLLSKSIMDASLYELIRQLEYKAKWYGRTVIKIDKWFPSSKTCSNCGFILESLPLHIREWVCPRCIIKHDRDFNASINILHEGKRTVGITELAYCPDVSPIVI